MLILERKDGEPIDGLLKRYKRKHRAVQVTKKLRARKEFVKPSVQRRQEIMKAKYIGQKFADES
ncbi:MAG: 30S ribosomal protein S21 [Saprospiraceae bacterium]